MFEFQPSSRVFLLTSPGRCFFFLIISVVSVLRARMFIAAL